MKRRIQKIKNRIIVYGVVTAMLLAEIMPVGYVLHATETSQETVEENQELDVEETDEATTTEESTETTQEINQVETTEETVDYSVSTMSEEVVYEDLKIKDDYTLTSDMIVGDLSMYSKVTFDLNGHVLKIMGDADFSNGVIEFNGGELDCYGNLSINKGADIYMNTLNDYLFVEGDTTFQGDVFLTAGTIEARGDFTANSKFKASENHNVIFSGVDLQNINLNEKGYFNKVELKNYSTEGIFISYSFNYESLIDNGCIVNYADLSGERGYTLEEDVTIDGMYYLLTDKLDLNGHTMTINGDLVQGGGTIHLNGGNLIVNGDYRVQTRKEKDGECIYGKSLGILIMDNADDYLYIQGDYINESSVAQSDNLTDGIMEVKGNITISMKYNEKVYMPTDNHTLVLSGDAAQNIVFNDGDGAIKSDYYCTNYYVSRNHLCNLDMQNTSDEGILFTEPLYVSGTIKQNETTVNGEIVLSGESSFYEDNYYGDVFVFNSLNLEKPLCIVGELSILNDVSITGDLTVEGDVKSNKLFKTYSNSVIHQQGTMIVEGSLIAEYVNLYIYDTTIKILENTKIGSLNMTGGILELHGDLTVTSSITCDGASKCIFNGSELQNIVGTDKGTFGIVELQNYSDEGIVTDGIINCSSIIGNGCKLRYDDIEGIFGWKLNRDEKYEGNLILIGDKLDLNNHELTVTGDLIQLSGDVDINGGKLNVEGSYIHSSGTLDINKGTVIIEKDYRMQVREEKDNNYTYTNGTGVLVMNNAEDYFLVKKDFVYVNNNSNQMSLNDGILELKGDFTILEGLDYRNWFSDFSHCTILSGEGIQTIYTENGLDYFGNLYINNKSVDGVYIKYKFRPLSVRGCLNDYDSKITGEIGINTYTELADNEFSASYNGPLDKRYDLHILGDLFGSGNIHGDIIVDGNATISNERISNATITGNLTVKGNCNMNYNNNSYIRSGEIKVAGDFTANEYFKAIGTNKVILNGSGLQTITMAEGANFNIIELQNYSEEGVYSETTFAKNELIRNGCKLTYGDSDGVFGWALQGDETWDGDLILLDDTLNLNGHKLIVTGDFIQMSGTVDINAGELFVGGDYRMQSMTTENEETLYGVSSSRLILNGEDDAVKVCGDLILQSQMDNSGCITNGVIEIQGNIYVDNTYNVNSFCMSENAILTMSGNSAQNITTADESLKLNLAGFQYKNTSGEVISLPDNVLFAGHIVMGNGLFGAPIYINSSTTFENDYYKGDVYIEKGLETDYMLIDGNVTALGGISSGTIEIKGKYIGKKTNYSSQTSRIILSGNEYQTISMEEGAKINILEIKNSSTAGVYTEDYIVCSELIDENNKLVCGAGNYETGYKLTEDTVISGEYLLGYGTLDLNGYTLTIEGDMIHAGGTIDFNGGTMIVDGNYSMHIRNLDFGKYVYKTSVGILNMDTEKDYLLINGDAYFKCDSECFEKITNGTIEVKGNIDGKNSTRRFTTYNDNLFVLSGEQSQSIIGTFKFANLKLDNKDTVEINYNLYVTGTLEDNCGNITGTNYTYLSNVNNLHNGYYSGNLYINGNTSFEQNVQVDKSLYISSSIDMNGYEATADSVNITGSVVLNGGRINCKNDMKITNSGVVTMTNPEDYVCVGGKLIIGSNKSVKNTFMSGTLELKGDFEAGNNATIVFGGDHKTILAIKRTSTGRDYIQNISFGDNTTSKFNTLILKKEAENYVFSRPLEEMANEVVYDIVSREAIKEISDILLVSIEDKKVTIEYTYSGDTSVVLAYEIYRNGIYLGMTNKCRYDDMDIMSDTEYIYEVYPLDEYGNRVEKSPSLKVLTLKDEEKPSVPEKVAVKAITSSSVTISWLPAEDNCGIEGYEIYRDGELYGASVTSEYKDTDASVDKAHTYYVVAVDINGNKSNVSESISAMGSAPQITDIYPKDESDIENKNTKVQVYFKNLGHSDYTVDIEYYDSSTKTWFYVASKDLKPVLYNVSTYCVSVDWDTSMLNNTEYDVRFIVKDNDGGQTSRKVTYYLDKIPPSAPTELETGANNGVVELQWTISTSADCVGYKIYRRTIGDEAEFELIDDVKSIYGDRYKDVSANIGETYEYSVTSYDEQGNESDKTSKITATCNEDTVLPIMKSATPQAGKVNGTVKVDATASDNRSVSAIKFSYRAVNESEWVELDTVLTEENSASYRWNTKNLADGIYYINMVAVDSSGNESSTLYTRRYEVDNTGVEKIEITDVSSGASFAQIRWKDVSDTDFAYFQIEKWNGTQYEKVDEVENVLGYTAQNLKPNTIYYYRVVGYDKLGNRGIPSDSITVKTEVDTVSPSITRIDPVSSYYRDILPLSMAVSDNGGVSRGIFYYSFDKENYTKIAEVRPGYSGNNVIISYNLDLSQFSEGSIYIKFEAYDTSGNKSNLMSDGNEIVCEYRIDRTAPTQIQNFNAYSGDGYVELTWDEAPEKDIKCYKIYRAELEDGIYSVLNGNWQSLNYYDTSIEAGRSYMYKIVAVDIAGNVSIDSNECIAMAAVDTTAPEILGLYPSMDYTVGKKISVLSLATDNSCLGKIVVECKDSDIGVWVSICEKQIRGEDYYLSEEVSFENMSEGKYDIRVYAIDKAGNQSEYYESSFYLDTTAPTSRMEVVSQNFYTEIHFDIPEDEDFSYFEVYRREVLKEEDFESIGKTNKYTCYDTDVTPYTQYEYKAYVYDINGNYSVTNSMAACATDHDTEAPVAVLPQRMCVISGMGFSLDGGECSDNVRIDSFEWDMGNGDIIYGRQPEYTYEMPGTYDVTLTVRDAEGNIGTATMSVQVFDADGTGTVKITVTDRNGTPIPYAFVYLNDGASAEKSYKTDQSGNVTISAPEGEYEIAAYKSGYTPSDMTIQVSGYTTNEYRLAINSGEIVVGDFKIHKMELQEMIDAGVDIYDPANMNNYVFEATFYFSETPIPVKTVYYGGGGGIGIPSSGGAGGGGIGIDYQGGLSFGMPGQNSKVTISQLDLIEDEKVTIGESVSVPIMAYVRTTQSVSWLKEMYMVDLGIMNMADSKYVIEDSTVTLNLPEGLSLADMTDGGNYITYNLGSLAGQESTQASWVVRGDKPGDYKISADFNGTLLPFGCDVDVRFNAEQEIKISGYHGLYINIMPETTSYTGENYYIQFAISNNTGMPLYNFQTTIGSYMTESMSQEIYVIDPETGEKELYDSVEGKVYSYGELSMCSQTVVMRDDDRIYVQTLAPGETIYGTYVTTVTGTGNPEECYYELEDHIVKTIEGAELGVTVNVNPISGHVSKQIIKPVEEKTYYGDPVDVTTGAYTDYYEAISVMGDGVLSLDLFYDSRMTEVAGELGYGWNHNFESFITRENGLIRFYTSPSTYATFINSDSVNGILYGEVNNGVLELADISDYQDVTYESISTDMSGYILTEHTDDTFTMKTPGGYVFTYDAQGKLIGIKHPDGSSVSLTHTENQTIVTETRSGNRLKLDYSHGKLISVSDDTGRKTTFTYSEDRLVKIINPMGESIQYEYDEQGRLIRAYNHNDICFVENIYDEDGRVIIQKDAYGEEISFSYDDSDSGMITYATDAKGNTTTIKSDYRCKILSITTSDGASESYTYDEAGNKTSVTDVDGNTSYYTYDDIGRVIGMEDDDEKVTYTYDIYGNLISISSDKGEQVNLTYDALGNITSVSNGEKTLFYTYDEAGELVSVTRDGKGTQYYSYDEDGRISSVTNELGATATVTYDSRGNAISMTDADGAVTSYEYDDMNRVTAIIYPNGGREERDYDIYGNVTSIKDTLGNVTTYTYDNMGRQTAVTYADGSTIGYEYDSTGNVTTVTYPDDTKEYYEYNSQGKVTKITHVDGSYITYTYDIAGRITSLTDETGYTTTYTYDDTGKLDMIELPDSQLLEPIYSTENEVENIVLNGQDVLSYTYDDSGNMTSSTDALGSVTNYTYNCWGELLSITDALGNTTAYSYDGAGCCIGVTYPDGSTHSISYDKSGRPVKVSTYVTDIITGETREISSSLTYDLMGNVSSYKDEMGNVTNYQYDLMNQLIKVTDDEGNIQAEYTYDCLGRVISVRDSSGITTTYTYNKSGLVEKIVQTSSSGATKTYSYTYDTMGRLLTVTDPTGVTTSQNYDGEGNLREIVYPQGGGISYTYDDLGRVTVETLSIGTNKTVSYSEEGLLETSTNGRGQETAYTYDQLGRLVSFTDEVGTVSYTYDKNGNLISTTEITVDGETHAITRTYDSMNRVATYTDYNGNTIKYGYDELGNIVSLTYPGGEIVRYSYYDNGLLAAVVDGEGYKTAYTYDSSGRELTITKADGSVETKTYNDKGYLATVTLEAAGEEVYSYIYTYDDWGNITNIIYESQSEEETDLSTLTSSTMTYDESNRMLTYNGEEVLYDEDGNMVYGPLDGEMVTFTYDCRNRLVRAGDTTYEYDAEDVRIAVETSEYREEYVTDSVTTLSRVLEVERVYKNIGEIPATSSVGTTVGITTKESEGSTYYYGNGLIYEKNSTYGLMVYNYDHLGSTKLITDTNGCAIAVFSYGTYGELLTDTTEYDITLRFLYSGELGVITDDNSLCYMRSRYYNPEIKR
ncbi:MAG: hypothetical protein J6J16_01710, partial [Lachnospiraceae bacterium]|nr:hypothetical protein [Lachnospiraceae bacterium]